ncbi:type II toxin-antitoxin system RelE/ParE family toxin [Litchfieldella xinjiangensis]|uniref:type II toxin-antitoxin system RelE/ParE family toxin n=1 Tax=Litchfieldella xinjiangensis TaxID=1166948 RepID=UPI0009DE33CD|nr:type II toxin-antitoxin system RelE/ParE family toxin [Halomonas xinjiangensis]
MRVLWTTKAVTDRVAIWDYLEERNPQAAFNIDQRFSAAADRLADFPEQGRPGIVPGTRELFPHENYRIVYELEGDTVWILALVHTSRLWPLRYP